jgi:hypothetical protein
MKYIWILILLAVVTIGCKEEPIVTFNGIETSKVDPAPTMDSVASELRVFGEVAMKIYDWQDRTEVVLSVDCPQHITLYSFLLDIPYAEFNTWSLTEIKHKVGGTTEHYFHVSTTQILKEVPQQVML